MDSALKALPTLFGILRKHLPILRLGDTYLVTRNADVREVLANDGVFGVPYGAKLDLIMGGEPFMLGMADNPDYRASLASLRNVVRPGDFPMLARRVEDAAEQIVAAADGQIEIVDTLVRRIAFDVIADYLGVSKPAQADLRVWGTRLFEYQFIADDAPLKAEVAAYAPAMRAHIDADIARARTAPGGHDTLIDRCLAKQAQGETGFSDVQIRTNILGLIVGGPPQPPMVLPQAMEQLLRRPLALAAAQRAARADDDRALSAHIMEAMRFDPLAPWLPRVATTPHRVGSGRYAQDIPAGAKILASIASAMRDGDHVPFPGDFDATRAPDQYLHFGFGVHQCFGLELNRATLHLMVKPLLKRQGLRRAAGPAGHLRKRGAFASALFLSFD